MTDVRCRNRGFPFTRQGVLIFSPPCSHRLQSAIDAVVFFPALHLISLTTLLFWHWFIAPFSVIHYLPHSPKGDTVCNQRWVWPSFTHTSLSSRLPPPPNVLASHLRGYRRLLQSVGCVPGRSFKISLKSNWPFFCNGSIICDQYLPCSKGSSRRGFVSNCLF